MADTQAPHSHESEDHEGNADRTHRYRTSLEWQGSTEGGYEAYERAHTTRTTPATTELRVTADPVFRGDPALLNPEQLLVMAASSCQLLSFLAAAARARVDVIEYTDDAVGEMPHGQHAWIERIALRPTIVVNEGPTEERVRHLVEVAHRECFIANSLRSVVSVEPTIRFANADHTPVSNR